MKRSLIIATLATLLLTGLTVSAFAQTGNAQLGGIVQDATRALIPGVTITAKNNGTGIAQTQITNESGIYSFLCCNQDPTRFPPNCRASRKPFKETSFCRMPVRLA